MTPAPTSDSVETLRSQLDDAAKHIGQQRERIKALEAEVAEHSAKTMTMVANHAALTDRLRDALAPFAAYASIFENRILEGFGLRAANAQSIHGDKESGQITLGDLRKARDALTPAKQSQSIADELVEVGEGK